MKRVLITGKNSYIGNAVAEYLEGSCVVEKISLRGEEWREIDFKGYDAVLHVAGKAHADISKVSEETKKLYYQVNGELTGWVAEKAKAEGVPQFIYLSSVIVYGDSAPVGKCKRIDAATVPNPTSFYGDSKLQGEKKLEPLADADFKVAVLRLPMIYGKNSKGNYSLLEKIAGKMPIFPKIQNERSMLYIENLAEFIRLLIESGEGGLFFPQNQEYVTTAQMVQMIAAVKGKKLCLWSLLNPLVWLASKVPGKVGNLANKAFGSLTVEQKAGGQQDYAYRKYSLEESIRRIHEN